MDSNILKERWKNYQTRYEYASNIDFEDLSHFIKLAEINTDGFEIVKDALSKKTYRLKILIVMSVVLIMELFKKVKEN